MDGRRRLNGSVGAGGGGVNSWGTQLLMNE